LQSTKTYVYFFISRKNKGQSAYWVCTKFYFIHKDTLLYQLIVITTSTDAPATSVLDHSTYTIIIFIINTHKQMFSIYHKFKSIAWRPRKPSFICTGSTLFISFSHATTAALTASRIVQSFRKPFLTPAQSEYERCNQSSQNNGKK
jgi:hypothetical protein